MSNDANIEALSEYLPFYVNGTIDAADKAAVDEALPDSAELRAALEQERRLQEQFKCSMDAALDDSDTGPELNARSVASHGGSAATAQQRQTGEAHGSKSDASSGSLTSALAFLNPRNWSPAVTLAGVAVVAGQAAILITQSGTISNQNDKIANLEEKNSKLTANQTASEERADIAIKLAEGATWRDAADLFGQEDLSIVSGTPQGELLVSRDDAGAKLDEVIERLDASPLVADASEAK